MLEIKLPTGLTESQIAKWTVLIVDDEPDNINVPRLLLQHYGAQVHTAENGAEGMATLIDVTPTFILLDLSMPEMDGWEMLKAVRARSEFVNLPVIALTAHAMVGDEDRALKAGFDGYITKPFMFGTFLNEIDRLLRELREKGTTLVVSKKSV